jgi:1-pyrroline-5-carboxylate dehydrogenase
MAGMTVASIVTGNTVVLKPSSDAPTIAFKFFEILEEAGLPAGVVNFMTGSGAEVGDVIVDHPKTRYVAFTGSKEIGLRINERAAKVNEGQIWIKRVVAEMGGKDAIIVAADADLDEAATGVVQSAFGFQGQKCSACSRAIIDAKVYDQMLAKIVERTARIKLSDPTDATANMSAVINEKAFKSINDYIEKGKSEGGRVIAGGGSDGEQGFFIEPTVIADVSIPVDFTRAITNARMHQAVTSSTAAQVIAIDPSVVCVSPRSSKIRASTGKAVMLIATPMNNANALKEVPAGANPW